MTVFDNLAAMDITLRQIKYFIAAAETGKITSAASLLSISPSSITESIKELEKIIGVTLITRHRRGINLTFDGYRFLQHCYDINTTVSNAEFAIKNSFADISGDISLGLTITVTGYFIASPLARFRRAFPQIRIKLLEYPRDRIEIMLMEGKLDLAVLLVSNVNNENLHMETLVRSKRRLWTSVNHPFCGKTDITLRDISKEPYIQLMIDEAGVTHLQFWHRSGLTPNIAFRTESVEAVRSMVAVGSGVTILSDMVYRPWSLEGVRIEAHDIVDGVPTMDVGLAWSKDRKLSKSARTFIEFFLMEYTSGSPSAAIGKARNALGD
ncbi:MAG: LysR family transcriptional regulator [Desulfosarcinaceae bacterium]